MHTTFVIIPGLVLLGLCLGVAHVLGGAGRSAAEEIPFLLLVFAIPAAAAFVVWWKLAHPPKGGSTQEPWMRVKHEEVSAFRGRISLSVLA